MDAAIVFCYLPLRLSSVCHDQPVQSSAKKSSEESGKEARFALHPPAIQSILRPMLCFFFIHLP
jgi:hypothetical protein